MPLSDRLRNYLEFNHAEYTVSTHPNVFTAREVAMAEHLPPREVAKNVVVIGDGAFQMLLVPANRLVDVQEARHMLEFHQMRLATEQELGMLFPDFELGAMPPLGPIFAMPVYMDSVLAGEPEIVFNAGNHREAIHMKTSEFRRLVEPKIVSLVREPALS